MWSKDWFFVYTETEETSKCSYLKAEMDVGDNVDDEWMVAWHSHGSVKANWQCGGNSIVIN